MTKVQRIICDKWLGIEKVFIFLCLFLCLFYTGKANAAEPPKTIKVGYDISGVLTRKDADGNFRGYNVEFLYEIAKYTNWQYEYVPYKSWSVAMTDLENGKIDLLPTVLKTPDRENTMLFGNHWMGMIHVALVVPKDDRKHFYGDITSLQGIRIGVRRQTKDGADVQQWAKEAGLHYELSTYENNKELLDALDAGKIDAAGLSYIGLARKYRTVMEFAPQEMYFAIAPQRPDLKFQLDFALGQIGVLNPAFYTRAMEQLTGQETNPSPIFSMKEQNFIQKAKPIRVTFLKQAPPFSYLDSDGKEQGVLIKLLARLTELSGLKFSLVEVNNPEAAIKAVHEGRADIVGRITNNLFFAKQKQLRLTTPYTNIPLVQVSKEDTKVIHKIGMQEHCQMDTIHDQECLGQSQDGNNATSDIELFPTAADMFAALVNGKIDAIFCDSITAEHFTEKQKNIKFDVQALQPYSYNFTLGVGEKTDPALATILDKSLRCVDGKEIDEMFTQSRLERATTIRGLLERLPVSYLAAFGIFLLALVLGLIIALIRLSKHSRERMVLMKQAAATEQERLKVEALEKSAEEKNQFFANISHDMRTPLNAIIGLSSLAGEEQDKDVIKDYLSKIQSSGDLLKSLINDTLNISKLNSGKVELKLEPVPCEEIFNDVVVPIKEAADAKNIEFVADKSQVRCKAIMADKLNLEKILLNLLTNAVKYTPQGGHIKFSVRKETTAVPDMNNMLITVQDDGIGMSKEFLPHLYDTFSQEDVNGQGTGLGMSIVKHLVDLMQGTITVQSVKGKGTTFTVSLPMQEAKLDDGVQEQAAEEVSLEKLQGKKGLLCEDNEINRQIAVAVLKRKGVNLVTAENGQKGVETFKNSSENEFAFILMDVRMPVMDGMEATTCIRALPRADAKTVPIIAITANTFPEDIAACLEAGMNDHVGKPLNPTALYETILKYLQ